MTTKTNTHTHAEIASALGISRARVTKLASKGMPVSSVGAATEWRAKRSGTPAYDTMPESIPTLPAVEPVSKAKAVGMIAQLEAQISELRQLVALALRRAHNEIESGDGEAAKRAGDTYTSQHRHLILLENTLRQRRIDAGQLVPLEAAVENYGKRLSTLLAALDAEEYDFAIAANPDNPGRAVKAFRAMRYRVRCKAANMG